MHCKKIIPKKFFFTQNIKKIKNRPRKMALNIGTPAPNFTLFNTEKQPISLQNLKGKNVLILFFPLAFTDVCTAELCSTQNDLTYYNNLNATVLGISVDSIFTLNQFKNQNNIQFDLLSDFNKTTAQQYEAYYPNFVFDMQGVARRAAFVVDSNGIIQYAEVLESAGNLPNFDAIKQTLEQLA